MAFSRAESPMTTFARRRKSKSKIPATVTSELSDLHEIDMKHAYPVLGRLKNCLQIAALRLQSAGWESDGDWHDDLWAEKNIQ